MNWEAIVALSEVTGAVAVVVSLIYLAVQVKQNTDLAKTEYHTSSANSAARFQDWKAASTENARIFRTGMLDFQALNADERVILDGVLLDLVLVFKDIFEAHERGFMDAATYMAWKSFIGTNMGMPGARSWWEQGRVIFIGKIQIAVDEAIKETPPYQELMSIVFEE